MKRAIKKETPMELSRGPGSTPGSPRFVPMSNRIIVDPYYDAERAYTLYIPDSSKNPMSQQGIIQWVPEDEPDLKVGERVLYHPFTGEAIWAFGQEYLVILKQNVVGYLLDNGTVAPLPDLVVIKPEFPVRGRPYYDTEHTEKKGSLFIPKQALAEMDSPEPSKTGTILRVGSRVTEVKKGQRILYRPDIGNEIGIDVGDHHHVVYTLWESHILAILD